MNRKEKARKVIAILKQEYPEARCQLQYKFGYELMIAGRLSAQCRDERVNQITPKLFAKYPTLEAFGNANVADVEEIIKPCGLFRTKAKDIVKACAMLKDEFGGRLPDDLNALLKLPGIGRKTANLLLGDVFGKPAVVCDTHCIRITNRLGLCGTKAPARAEEQLRAILPPEESTDFCHRLVFFGRDVCRAQKPLCSGCKLAKYCLAYRVN